MTGSMILMLGLSAVAAPGRFTLCKLDREVRTLKVETFGAENNCRSLYTKYGKEQNIGEAQNLASCESYANRVQETLEKAGWNCQNRDASSSDVSDKVQ